MCIVHLWNGQIFLLGRINGAGTCRMRRSYGTDSLLLFDGGTDVGDLCHELLRASRHFRYGESLGTPPTEKVV